MPGGPIGPGGPTWLISSMELATGANGNIIDWNIDLIQGTGHGSAYGLSTNPSLDASGLDPFFIYGIAGAPGPWSIAATPEPASFFLLGTGLVGLVGLALCRMRSPETSIPSRS
jgi:hypothetical protein